MTQRYRGTEQEASDNRVSHLPCCRDLLCALSSARVGRDTSQSSAETARCEPRWHRAGLLHSQHRGDLLQPETRSRQTESATRGGITAVQPGELQQHLRQCRSPRARDEAGGEGVTMKARCGRRRYDWRIPPSAAGGTLVNFRVRPGTGRSSEELVRGWVARWCCIDDIVIQY